MELSVWLCWLRRAISLNLFKILSWNFVYCTLNLWILNIVTTWQIFIIFWDVLCPGLDHLSWNYSPWGTYLERSIDHMARKLIRKPHTFVLWYRLTREVHPCVRVFQVLVRGGDGIGNFTGAEGTFYRAKGTWGGVILTIRTFFKLKTAFCEYWTSIKNKFNMTCVLREYEIKTKMEAGKNTVFIEL